MELMLLPDSQVMEALSIRVLIANAANKQRNTHFQIRQDLAATTINGSLMSAVVAIQSGVPNLLTVNLSSSSEANKTMTAQV
jgi:hypothetical protein